MDRNTVTGLILILIVMVAWGYFSMPSEQELRQRKAEQAQQDSLAAVQADSQNKAAPNPNSAKGYNQTQNATSGEATLHEEDKNEPQEMGIFSAASVADTSKLVVKTPFYRTTFTNVGGGPSKFILKEKTWDNKPVNLTRDTSRSAYTIGFLTNQNYNVETNQLLFEQVTGADSISVQAGESKTVRYALNISDSKRILLTYTLSGDSRKIDLEVTFEGLKKEIIGGTIDFGWEPALNFTEKDRTTEAPYASAYVYTGGELEQLKLDEAGRNEQNYNGTIDWVSTRTKFFTQIIETSNTTQGALLIGEQTGTNDKEQTLHHYESYITTDLSAQGTASFQMYVGPMEYYGLNNFDKQAFNMVDVGYSWLRWMSEPLVRYIIIPYFDFVDNYMSIGLAIILFAILIKMVLYPLTKKSYRSMAAMKELQPKMQEIKEKYEDPQKQQKATMKLYKEQGVNPLGGCWPNLLQLPILVTLWRFFHNSFLIRQQQFLWANDLSAPDYIIHLPFHVPFLGAQVGGFVLLMTGAMMLQSKLTGGMGGGMGGGGSAGGPNMKMLQYVFPFMLLFIFNNFAAGLSLYYLIYNLVSIGQQLLIYRQMDKEKELVKA